MLIKNIKEINKMAKYKVMITEILELLVEVAAENETQAEKIVRSDWMDSKYVLSAGNFTGVKFKAISEDI